MVAASAPTSTTGSKAVSAQPLCTDDCRAITRWSRRKLLLAGTLALVIAIPGPANSFTLDKLLDMPFEQLLRLEITSRHPPKVAALWRPSANVLRAAEHRDAT
jgi:hypothetical protein